VSNYYLCAECARKRQLFVGTGEVDCQALPSLEDARVMPDGGPGTVDLDPLEVCPHYEPRRVRYERPRIAASLENLTKRGEDDAGPVPRNA